MSAVASKSRPVGPLGCAARARSGELCGQPAIKGTDLCRIHPGKALVELKAQGQVVVELAKWGLGDELVDPGTVLLRLVAQSSARVELYSWLLERSYRAAEHAANRPESDAGGLSSVGASLSDGDPGLEAHNRSETVDDILSQGGVAALIGHKKSATARGDVFNTEEALRGLVQLEGIERDRCARFAAAAVAANLGERQVRLLETQGAVLGRGLRWMLEQMTARLELDAAGITIVQELIADMFRGLHTGTLTD